MKAHFGVDSRSKLIHAVVATPANVADSTVLPDLLHGNETRVWGDQAYRGQRAKLRYRGLKKHAHGVHCDLRARQSVHGASASIVVPRGVECALHRHNVQSTEIRYNTAAVAPTDGG
jgi:IS5 family transposase